MHITKVLGHMKRPGLFGTGGAHIKSVGGVKL